VQLGSRFIDYLFRKLVDDIARRDDPEHSHSVVHQKSDRVPKTVRVIEEDVFDWIIQDPLGTSLARRVRNIERPWPRLEDSVLEGVDLSMDNPVASSIDQKASLVCAVRLARSRPIVPDGDDPVVYDDYSANVKARARRPLSNNVSNLHEHLMPANPHQKTSLTSFS
jgi:hypothetical protein